MEEKTKEELIEDYEKLFDVLDAKMGSTCKELGIGPGVSTVVLVRMSAMICVSIGDMDEEEFVEFARQHYKMSKITVKDFHEKEGK